MSKMCKILLHLATRKKKDFFVRYNVLSIFADAALKMSVLFLFDATTGGPLPVSVRAYRATTRANASISNSGFTSSQRLQPQYLV